MQVAEAIDMSPLELHRLLADIEAGGVIRPRGWGNVSVQPEHLRAVLVATNFYGPYPISIEPCSTSRRIGPRPSVRSSWRRSHGREPSELRTLLTVQ